MGSSTTVVDRVPSVFMPPGSQPWSILTECRTDDSNCAAKLASAECGGTPAVPDFPA